ncbi:MAG: hypothetical protein Kow00124_09260 [Anaerolineae bacterium]
MTDQPTTADFMLPIMDAHLEPSVILDSDSRVIIYNNAWQSLPPDSAPGGVRPGAGELYLEACQTGAYVEEGRSFALGLRAVLGGYLRRFDMEYARRAAGRQQWFMARVRHQAADGRVLIYLQDISRQKLAEQEMQRLATIVENSPSAVIITDPQARIQYVNRKFVEITGYSREEVLGQNPRILQSGQTPRETYVEMWATITAGLEWNGEFINRTRDGTVYWEHARIIPLKDEQGFITHYAAIKEDISQQRQAEQSSHETEMRYRLLVETSPDAIALVSMTGEFLTVNRQNALMHGYDSVDEFLRQHPNALDTIHPQHRPLVLEQIRRVALGEAEKMQSFELLLLHRDGSTFPVETRAAVIRDVDGQPAALMAVTREISERKQLEEALVRQRRELHQVIASMPSALLRLDGDSRLIAYYVPAHMTTYLKLSDDDLGLPIEQILPIRLCKVIREAISSGLAEAGGHSLEHRLEASAPPAYLMIRPSMMADSSEVLVVLDDITERKLIEESEREQRQMADALRAITSVISSSLDLEDVLDHILSSLEQVVPHDAGSIMLVEDGVARIVRSRGHDVEVVSGLRFSVAETPNLRQMLETGQPTIIDEAGQQPGWTIVPGLEWVRANVSAPIQVEGLLVGFISLDSRSSGFFSPAHAERLMAFAQQCAVAIHNARLYRQAQEMAAFEERQRIARDLHDAVSQTLFSASIMAEMLARMWDSNPEQVRDGLLELRDLTRGAQAEMRILLLELRPAALADADLEDLLPQLSTAFSGRSGVPVDLRIETPPRLPPDVKIAAFRIVQEALNNIQKHAGATQVVITLRGVADGLELHIIDNGAGFDLAHTPQERLGLKIMQERAASAGASLSISSTPGQGTDICLIWHIKDSSE